MSVTLQAAQLIQPHGELDCDFFPDGMLDARIGGWLNQARAKVEANSNIDAASHNEAAKAWTYYLAYSYNALRLGAMPNSASVNKGADSVSFGADRPEFWQQRADAAIGLFNGYLIIRSAPGPRESMTIPLEVRY